MQWRKTIYKTTIRIEATEAEREEIPAKNLIRLAGCGRKKFREERSCRVYFAGTLGPDPWVTGIGAKGHQLGQDTGLARHCKTRMSV